MSENKNIEMQVFNGVDYDTLYPKTKITQVEGLVDGYYTKDETLTNATKNLYGLDSSATPNDVFALIGNGWIPSGKGVLVIKAVDGDGNDAANIIFTVNPAINSTSNFSTNSKGKICLIADPGTYTISTSSDIFTSATPSNTSITIEDGIAKLSNFVVKKITSGEADITESTKINIPSWLTSVDLFAVGGGASGHATTATTDYGAVGGCGGYTATLLNQNLSGKTLEISIGAGGASVTGNDYPGTRGNGGGATSISISGGSTILTALGGQGDKSDGRPSGGSGGGGFPGANNVTTGGSDGSDGSGGNPGLGQGTTTRKFGESGNTLYASGGGGAESRSSSRVYSSYGGPGGGMGKGYYIQYNGRPSSKETYKGGDATGYGGGGGGIYIYYKNGSDYLSYYESISGAGKQGMVSIRW